MVISLQEHGTGNNPSSEIIKIKENIWHINSEVLWILSHCFFNIAELKSIYAKLSYKY